MSEDDPFGSCDFEDIERELGAQAVRDALRRADFVNPAFWPTLDLALCGAEPAPAREWTVDQWLPRGKATLLTGDGGVGKSLLAQMLATCIAIGAPFLGVDVVRARAAYLTWEDDPEELWRRQEAICAMLGVRMASLAGALELTSLVEAEDGFLFITTDDGAAGVSKRGRALESRMGAGELGLLVLDNASQIAGINHNEINEVAPLARWVNRMAKEANGSVLLLHHPNKAGEQFLGSVAYTNQFRSRLFMSRPADSHDPDLREITNPKANYARMGGRIVFRWLNGAFCRDEDLPDDMREQLAITAQAAGDNLTFLTCLRLRNEQERPVSDHPNSRTYAPLVFSEMVEARGISKKRFAAAMDRLFGLNLIGRGVVCRVGGKDREGIIERADSRADPPLTVRADPRAALAPTCAHTLPISKDILGAAPRGAAPDWGDDPAADRYSEGDDG